MPVIITGVILLAVDCWGFAGIPWLDKTWESSKVNPKAVKSYVESEGLDYKQTLSKIKQNISRVQTTKMKKNLGKFDADTHMAKAHGFDVDPFGDDDF